MVDHLVQAGIVAFGGASILLVAKNNKWGFVHGLISQLFFMISSVNTHQIGIFVLAVIEIVLWVYGIYNWFFKKNFKKKSVSFSH